MLTTHLAIMQAVLNVIPFHSCASARQARLLPARAPGRGGDPVASLLRVLRQQLALDVVFVAEFVDGARVFRHVEGQRASDLVRVGDVLPLELSLCAWIADGRVGALLPDVSATRRALPIPSFPFPVGSYIGVPLRLAGGRLFGTLCGFTFDPSPWLDERDVDRMQVAAGLIARLLDPEAAPAR